MTSLGLRGSALMGRYCYDFAHLCPGGIRPSFLEWSGLVQIVWDPQSTCLFVRPTFHVIYVACAMAWHMSFFLYPCFGHNLAFICSVSIRPLHSIFRTSLLFYFLCLTLMLSCRTLIVYYLYLLFSISSYAFKS